MADTGYNWGAWGFVQKGAGNWSADALADNGTETGDAIALDGKAACIIGIGLAEDDTGAIDGVVTVYVLGETDVAYEETTIGSPWSFTITPVQADTVYKQFVRSIPPKLLVLFPLNIEDVLNPTNNHNDIINSPNILPHLQKFVESACGVKIKISIDDCGSVHTVCLL